ncbi:MAG: hypothetical protein WC628_09460 [Candidatus Omnitrophota bacterium]
MYNFCCTMCIDAFKEDPQKYIKNISQVDKPMTMYMEGHN